LRKGGSTGRLIGLNTLRTLSRKLKFFRKAGANDITVDIIVAYGGQCNLEMDTEFLATVAALKVPLTISCYEDEDLRED
jgi:hypothetical protein